MTIDSRAGRSARLRKHFTSLALLCATLPSMAQQSAEHAAIPAASAASAQPAPADSRTATLTKSLGLTDQQAAEVDKILAAQREQIRKLWQDSRIPPAYRVGETRAINAKAEDQIRAILTDAQKKKYIAPRPNELPPTVHSDLEHWLNATKPN